jgi:ribonuclease III
MRADLTELESRLGHTFVDRQLLVRALTHRSVFHSHKPASSDPTDDNEQLEFLGDAVLGFLVSDALVRRHPDLREGVLSKRKSVLVSREYLAEVGRCLDLGAFLILGKGEDSLGGRTKPALLANAVEALIAVLYLDAGIEVAREFVDGSVLKAGAALEWSIDDTTDYKTALQELAQAEKKELPHYELLATDGPSHARRFTVEARWSAQAFRAEASSKKAASQLAAKGLLEKLRYPENGR